MYNGFLSTVQQFTKALFLFLKICYCVIHFGYISVALSSDSLTFSSAVSNINPTQYFKILHFSTQEALCDSPLTLRILLCISSSFSLSLRAF